MQETKIKTLKNNSIFYKLDFGLNNIDDLEKTDLLIFFALLSGFSGIDIPAKEEILNISIEAIKKARQKATELNIEIDPNFLLYASLEIKRISNLNNDKLLKKIEFLKNDSVDVIDLHFNETDIQSNIRKVELIFNLFKEKIISVNLSRKNLSNIHMIDLLKTCFSYSKNNLIIEAEGLRLYKSDFNNILQTISTADIINKQFIKSSPKYKKIPMILGNCRNREIEELAQKCGVPFNGVSFFYQTFKNIFKNNYSYNNDEINYLISEIQLNYLIKK